LGFCSAPAGLAEPPFWKSCHGDATRGGSGSNVKMEAIISDHRDSKSMTRVLMFSKTCCVSFQQIVQYDSTTEHSVHRASLVRLFPTILNDLELVWEWWVRKRWVNDWNMVNMG
jgi:hypothetical protein